MSVDVKGAGGFEDSHEEPEASLVIGVDVARYGTCETVIVARRGDRAWITGRYRRQDTMATTGRVVRAIHDLGATEARVDVVAPLQTRNDVRRR